MKNISSIILLTGAILLSIPSAAKNIVTSSYNYVTQPVTQRIGSFEKLSVPSFIDVEFTTGAQQELSIYGADNVIQYVTLTVSNKTLTVSLQPDISIQGKTKLKVLITAPQLKEISITGSGDVDVRGLNTTLQHIEIIGSGDVEIDQLQVPSLTATVMGSGDVEIKNLRANTVNVNVSGSGDVEMNGTAENATFTVNGSGDIDADKLIVSNLTAHVNGSGDIECHADVSLTAAVNGSGDIEYRGKPQTINVSGRKSSIHPKYH